MIVVYCDHSADREAAVKRFDELRNTVVERIKRRECKEASNKDAPDSVRIGLMNLLRTLVHINPGVKLMIASSKGYLNQLYFSLLLNCTHLSSFLLTI